jgi:hypothetical protein
MNAPMDEEELRREFADLIVRHEEVKRRLVEAETAIGTLIDLLELAIAQLKRFAGT